MHTNTGAEPDNHLNHLDTFLNSDQNKGFNYYIFDEAGKLMTPTEISQRFTDVSRLSLDIQSQAPSFEKVLKHFLSDPRDIITDYNNAQVKMILDPVTMSGGRRHRTRNRRNKRRSTRMKKYRK
jgi:hypothetical protein